MTTHETGAQETDARDASEDEFFEPARAAGETEDNLPFDLVRPSDPVLARKMTQAVRLRRARLGRMVVAVVAAGVLVLLAAMAHLRVVDADDPGAPAWAVARGFAETHALVKASSEPEVGLAAPAPAEAAATISAL
ncbi:MAG: hypothetical protein ACRELB_21305 [Polyangiaceae bacterium]